MLLLIVVLEGYVVVVLLLFDVEFCWFVWVGGVVVEYGIGGKYVGVVGVVLVCCEW